MHQNSTSQTIHSLFLGAWYFMQSPDPSCKSHTVIELPENRKSVPWKMISYQKCLTVFLIFILQLASAAVFPFHGYFQLINSLILAEVLALGPERQTCLLAIAFWYLKCHSLDSSFLPIQQANLSHELDLFTFNHQQHLPTFCPNPWK